ncbi:hypothetical protein ACWYRQ_07120 [Clostridioides difficile]
MKTIKRQLILLMEISTDFQGCFSNRIKDLLTSFIKEIEKNLK